MNSLRKIWGSRFVHYMHELQKYLKYVFTGHLVIVLFFIVGASGYAYSEWLKEVPKDFPAAALIAGLIGLALTVSPPVTLLKPADLVYFLQLESKLDTYMKQSLRWTFFSQLPLPLLLLIIALPLLAAVEINSGVLTIVLVALILAMKWLYVETEYNLRFAREGEWVWRDRAIRAISAAALLYVVMKGLPLFIILIGGLIGLYTFYWRKAKMGKPFPYEHFIKLEQNRMMRFYRFANYFTDVPHIKGSVSRRRWLGLLFGKTNFDSRKAQSYLVRRTLIRTDDIFWLWVRLTVLSVLAVLFIPIPVVTFILVGSLAFASALQLVQALRLGDEFRMDMLFPGEDNERPHAIRQTVRSIQWIQTILVIVCGFIAYQAFLMPLLFGLTVFILSDITIRLSKENPKVY